MIPKLSSNPKPFYDPELGYSQIPTGRPGNGASELIDVGYGITLEVSDDIVVKVYIQHPSKKHVPHKSLREKLDHHNLSRASDDLEELLKEAEETNDYSKFDSYMSEVQEHNYPGSWWVDRPGHFSLLPVELGTDEFNRHTLAVGFPWLGRIVIPSPQRARAHYQNGVLSEICVATNHWVSISDVIDVGYGVKLEINPYDEVSMITMIR